MNQNIHRKDHHYFFKGIVTFLLATIAYSISYFTMVYLNSNGYNNYILGGLGVLSAIILLFASPFYFIIGLLEVSQYGSGLNDLTKPKLLQPDNQK